MLQFEDLFLIRICYKSGIVVEEWFTKFSISPTKVSWTTPAGVRRPLRIAQNLEDIESVWQLRHKRRLRWG